MIIIVYVYRATDNSVDRYNDKQYFDKFRERMISNLRLNNKLEMPNTKKNKIIT